MPILQRKAIHQDVGTLRIGGYIVSTTGLAASVGGVIGVINRKYANPDFSGEGYYRRSWLRVGSISYRVGSFNTGSGAWVTSQTAINAIATGDDFEISERIDPDDIDRFIDETVARFPVRREVGIPSIDGRRIYTLSGAASPNTIRSVLGVYYFAAPDSSLNRDRREFLHHEIVTTGSGQELRLPVALGASLQIVLDALLQLSIGPADAATVSLPDEEMVLWGVAARCYDLMIKDSSTANRDTLVAQRTEAARAYTRLAAQHLPEITKEITFEHSFDGAPPW